MVQWKTFAGGAVLATLLGTTALRADVTAEQVWQDYAATLGASVTVGAQDRQGDRLVLRDVAIVSEFEGGAVTGTLDKIELAEQGDGSVAITLPARVPLLLKAETPAKEEGGAAQTVQAHMRVSHDNAAITASGAPGDITYAFSAPKVAFTVEELVLDGEPTEFDLEVTLQDVAGTRHAAGQDIRDLNDAMTAKMLAVRLHSPDPQAEASVSLEMALADLAMRSSARVPQAVEEATMPERLAAGFSTRSEASFGKLTYTLNLEEAGATLALAGSNESGAFDWALDAERLSFGETLKGGRLAASGTVVPVETFDLAWTESVVRLLAPLPGAGEIADFTLLSKVEALTIGDTVWAHLDPAAILPRDPATLVIDLAGKLRWPQADLAFAPGAPPVELHALEINEVRLSAAGAELTAQGGFTFDNTDTQSYGGFPRPVGAAEIVLTGGNALLDRLVQLGVVAQDQAILARLMAGLFMRPGDGPDTLVSKIELTEDGRMLSNGQGFQ